jgi:hypothetical protein
VQSCTLLITAINCGINPTAKQGGAGRQGLEHRRATRRVTISLLCQDDAVKKIRKYKFEIRLKQKNKVIKTRHSLTGYREIELEIESVVGQNRRDSSATVGAVM